MVAWIVISCVIVLMIGMVIFFFFDNIKVFLERVFFTKNVYKKLDVFVNEDDQLLLNDVKLFFRQQETPTVIDHMVFCDKYIYVVKDFYAQGGIYGNIVDETLFNRSYKNEINKVNNPVVENQNIIALLCETFNVDPQDKLFVSIVVYNNSLLVPKELGQKKQESWFLPLKEMIPTIKEAEKDDVTEIKHVMTEKLAKLIKERSDQNKKEIAAYQAQRYHK